MKNNTDNRGMLRGKVIRLVAAAVIPFLVIIFYLQYSMIRYSNAYNTIVDNMAVANSYNLNFKNEMDESLYKMVVSTVKAEDLTAKEGLENPYTLLAELRSDFTRLEKITTDQDSRSWLDSLLRNIDTLENRVDDISVNLEKGELYDENIDMLDNNIYILTELIQDDIQYYIYYQTNSMETVRQNLSREMRNFLILSLIMILIVVGIVVLFSTAMSKRLVEPIDQLCGVTQQISQGDFTVRAETDTGDEIGVLAGSVNEMTENLEKMVTTIKDDERKMREAELRLLQEQINPHFLYNTLDTIVWLIEGRRYDTAEDVVVALSEFFRLVLSKGREIISIRDEERHISSYLQIQQVRYRDLLQYEIHLDQDLNEYQILKLTLQPIIENALYHGIKYKRAMGKILVNGYREEDRIVFMVKDDGVGMDPETLESLRDAIRKPCKETTKGFGLANVSERIRMHYGEEYGLTIDSVQGAGTTVIVTIPARVYSAEEAEG